MERDSICSLLLQRNFYRQLDTKFEVCSFRFSAFSEILKGSQIFKSRLPDPCYASSDQILHAFLV